ncbi:MAG TPA: SDR family oxidoreductase [Thermomicrobiales bacterium]|nr:SDR family oxidoreductase [Thermomicrobiales bacterium]
MNDRSLEGKVALVTGAGSGLGEATARALAEAGCGVACIDINGDEVSRVSANLIDFGIESVSMPCDVRDVDAVFETVESVVEHFERLDIIVNNAAIDHTVSIDEMTIEQWDDVLDINLRAPFLFAKAALPIMREQRSGHFINIASTAATRAWGNASAYHASKWGLIGFSRGLGVEGREDGIRTTTIIPGGMRTHFFDRFADQGIPMPDEANLQDPANVAEVIVFALSMPKETAMQEVIVTPVTETSWP